MRISVPVILLTLSDSKLGALLGGRFMWKVCVLSVIVILSVLIYRPFCKYICPLGAIYAPFNKAALVQMKVDNSKCTHCSACSKVCGMCVDPSVSPNSTECIRCGKCIEVCPVKALSYTSVWAKKHATETKKTDTD